MTIMKQTRNLLVAGAIALAAGVFSACGGGSGTGSAEAEAEAASLPIDGILGEYPKAVAEYEATEAAASAKYDELKKTNPEEASKFWSDYLNQGNTLKFKKETIPAIEKTLAGKEIPTEVAEGLPLKLDKNLTLDDKRHAQTSGVFTVDATKDTKYSNFVPVAFDADGKAIAYGDGIDVKGFIAGEGKPFTISYFISIKAHDAAGWAHLKKVVIMDKTSVAFKQAEEQVKAAKEAAKQ